MHGPQQRQQPRALLLQALRGVAALVHLGLQRLGVGSLQHKPLLRQVCGHAVEGGRQAAKLIGPARQMGAGSWPCVPHLIDRLGHAPQRLGPAAY